ncbi:hypothetical protein [Lampropedia aestuarii]|uniref:hypothetical protein n=1 Tax=Lampropedia aestuarii TaxID=2562762 RepID=UPI002468F1C5|nr:hypothetical protein [Lampropedia aestuarii]MDH5858748.1 hypothetical protein [Lampropedia aestuarii]
MAALFAGMAIVAGAPACASVTVAGWSRDSKERLRFVDVLAEEVVTDMMFLQKTQNLKMHAAVVTAAISHGFDFCNLYATTNFFVVVFFFF